MSNVEVFMSNKKVAVKTFQRQVLTPKTKNQHQLLKSIKTNDLTLGIGPAGSGKTLISVGMACEAFQAMQVNKILITRPNVESGEKLGFLPGDFNEKIAPYLVPIFDEMGRFVSQDEIKKMRAENTLEVCPLALMRGRTFHKTFMILDEAQNATYEQIIMFMTRLGTDSKMVLVGDIFQSDLPKHLKDGLKTIFDRLAQSNIDKVGTVVLDNTDIVRNPLISDILEALKEGD